jgi:hypothetical protein
MKTCSQCNSSKNVRDFGAFALCKKCISRQVSRCKCGAELWDWQGVDVDGQCMCEDCYALYKPKLNLAVYDDEIDDEPIV